MGEERGLAEESRMTTASVDERSLPPLFDVAALVATLWQRRLLIVGVAGAVFLLALAYVATTTPTYVATASLLIDPRDSRATNVNEVLPGIGADSAAISSQVSVIQSQDLLGEVMEAEHLFDDPDFASRGLLSRVFAQFGGSEPAPRMVALRRFQSRLSVERQGLTYVIDVSFTSTDPEKAARIVEAVVSRYRASLEAEKTEANTTVSSLLGDKIRGLQQSVSNAERAVEDFKVKNRILAAGAGGTLQTQIDQLSGQVLTAQAEVDQANNQYNLALAAGTSPTGLAKLSAILSSPTAEKLRDDYNRNAAALANLEATYGPRHPAMARLRSELDKIRNLMAVEAQRITSDLKARRDVAAQNVARLQARLDDLRGQSNRSDVSQVELRQLERQADAARAVLDDFMKRAAETAQIGGLQRSEVKVLSTAKPPVQPAWPKPMLILPVGAALGLIAGCGIALALGPVEGPAAAPLFAWRRAGAGPGEARAASRRGGKLANWDDCNLPGIAPGSAQDLVRALRAKLFRPGGERLTAEATGLAGRLAERLRKHGGPAVAVVSSLHDGVERRLAATLLGLGLQQAGSRVLLVELADIGNRYVAGLAVDTAPRGRAFTDAASGLITMVRAVPAAWGRRALSQPGALSQLLALAGGRYDFMIVLDRPMTEGRWEPPALAEDAGFVLFALSRDEQEAGAGAALEECLSADELARSATLVVSVGAASAGRPALNTDTAGPAHARRSAVG